MISLDTNVAIALINGQPAARRNLAAVFEPGESVVISVIVLSELMYGAEHSRNREHNLERVEAFLSGIAAVHAFDVEDAAEAAEVREELARVGRPIGPYDVLIAAQARRRNATFLTANVREFQRVKGLRCFAWSARP